MKVLLLGKSGMLGSYFLKYLSGREDFEMYAFEKKDLDVTESASLKSIFKQISPDFVINCSAYTQVDECESNKELAFNINGKAPGEIAKVCKEENAVLVHFSTDYVFDGNKADGYKEDDLPSPINVYGESKLEGEENIKKNMEKYYIIRTSWLFGENGKNFVTTMLDLAKTRDEIEVVYDQIGSPTYTKDVCDTVIKHFLNPYLSDITRQHDYHLTDQPHQPSKELPFGIYHLTNSGTTSWYEFALKIFKIMDIKINVKKVKSEQFSRPANRPKYSILLNTKIDDKLRPWQDALEAFLELHY